MKEIFSHRYCFIFLMLLSIVFASCQKEETEDNQRAALESYIVNTMKATVDEKDGVYLVMLSVDSSGQERIPVRQSNEVEFEYQAWTYNGFLFATSVDSIARKNNLIPNKIGTVKVGKGNLIAGLDRGLQRMALGDHGIILFPFTLGYGEQYVGMVPPESALIFEVIVTKVNGNIY